MAKCKSGMYISLGNRYLPDILRSLNNPEKFLACTGTQRMLIIQARNARATAPSWKLRHVCASFPRVLYHTDLCSCYSSIHSRLTAFIHWFLFPSPTPNLIYVT